MGPTMTEPFDFSEEELFDALPNHTSTSATLAEVCRKLCVHKMRDFDLEKKSRRLEQKVRRHLNALADKYPKLIEIDSEANRQLYRKKMDVNSSNKQIIRHLSVVQNLIGRYLPLEQQHALESQSAGTSDYRWRQFIYVAPSSICIAPQCDLEVKATVYTSIEQQQALSFTYFNSKREIKQKRMMPWGLMFKGESTYVLGVETHLKATKPATYAMHRMSDVRMFPAEPDFQAKPAEMKLADFCIQNDIGRFKKSDDKMISLVLRLFGDAAANIDSTPISIDQKITIISADERLLEAAVLSGYELEKFIRGLGANAEVIEPLELRHKLAREYQALSFRYAKDKMIQEHFTE